MRKILIIGSYNGQESFGDRCLLYSVLKNLKRFFGTRMQFISHTHQNNADNNAFSDIIFHQGLSYFYWRWHTQIRHLRLPLLLHAMFSFFTFPLVLILGKLTYPPINIVLKDIKKSSFLYFYGGTQLASPWFWFNFSPLFYTLLICRAYKIPVFFGPQQYGPQTKFQNRIFRLIIRFFVTDIRTRNKEDLELLTLKADKNCYDEVFSYYSLYFRKKKQKVSKSYIMVNIRGLDFTNQSRALDEEYRVFFNFLFTLQKKIKLPFKLFQMGKASFCDDLYPLKYSTSNRNKPLDIEILPYSGKDQKLLDKMRAAYGTISMSFHGCIFSLASETPAVPVIFDKYYKYKYLDFQKYTGGQNLPFIHLKKDLNLEKKVNEVCFYFKNYSKEQINKAKIEAQKTAYRWYSSIKKNSNNSGN